MTDRITRSLLVLAGLSGAAAVACGAYASHGLPAVRDARAVELWRMASQYQLTHAAALLGVAVLRRQGGGGLLTALAGGAFALGCLLFPGALYLLGWFGPIALGAVAPVGGVSFILGWLLLAAAGLRGDGLRGTGLRGMDR